MTLAFAITKRVPHTQSKPYAIILRYGPEREEQGDGGREKQERDGERGKDMPGILFLVLVGRDTLTVVNRCVRDVETLHQQKIQNTNSVPLPGACFSSSQISPRPLPRCTPASTQSISQISKTRYTCRNAPIPEHTRIPIPYNNTHIS